jgi:hypothetical protein
MGARGFQVAVDTHSAVRTAVSTACPRATDVHTANVCPMGVE